VKDQAPYPDVVDERLTPAPVVRRLAAAVDDLVVGLYVGGSVATGDYRPGVSDIDVVALVDRIPDPAVRRTMVAVHRVLIDESPGAGALHCVYVPRDDVGNPTRKHWTWAFDELFRRPLSGSARAELLADPVVVLGPSPSTWLPPMTVEGLRTAASVELSGYWTAALRKGAIWRQDVYVDHGATTVARADATIRDGRLITKTEAITRLPELGLAPEIVDGIAARRRGEHRPPLSAAEAAQRARTVRRFMGHHIERLVQRGARANGSAAAAPRLS
jgi:hypothetical protein